ncbi:MAG: glutamate formimidoyltransferase [Candidatus Izemoplasmatales bacterium]
MKKLVECVPNFSEGRDQTKIDLIMSTLYQREGVRVVNVESDKDYNRTVVTLIGEPEQIIEAMVPFTNQVISSIDMNFHRGEHARMGAIDVIPFIPLENTTMKDCVEYAHQLAALLSSTFTIPVFLYAEAATSEERILLPNIRKGEFEGMIDKIKLPAWAPDYGKPEIHPTFGAVAIGAREFLVAYNIDILSMDENIAKNISKAIRKSSGGFAHIQAGPVTLENRNHTQVTMNILNYKQNPLYRIFETVIMEAARYHIQVPSAEIVGLIPKRALIDSIHYYQDVNNEEKKKEMSLDEIVIKAIQYLHLRDFTKDKIIENFL